MKNRFTVQIVAVIGCLLTSAMTAQANAEVTQPKITHAHAPDVRSAGTQQKSAAEPLDVFSGLNLTDEQKAQVARIRREAESRKALIIRAEKLNEDQKNAMLLGYTRIENGQIFKVLTPTQQKEVRQRVLAHRAAHPASPNRPTTAR